MSAWIRCRTCRTPGDPERTPFCPACGDELRAASGAPSCPPPAVERAAARDLRSSGGFLAGLGVLGLIGTGWFLLGSLGGPFRHAAAAGLVLFIGGAAFFAARKDDPRVAAAGRALVRGFALVGILMLAGMALVFALFVYLFVVCTTGNARFAG